MTKLRRWLTTVALHMRDVTVFILILPRIFDPSCHDANACQTWITMQLLKSIITTAISQSKSKSYQANKCFSNHLGLEKQRNSCIPVTWTARASVKIMARFSSSESFEMRTTLFGSTMIRDNCGCTSQLPRPIIRWRAVLSTLEHHTQKHAQTRNHLLRHGEVSGLCDCD